MSKRITLSDLATDWKKAYKDGVVIGQQHSGYHFSSGVVAYDLALGQGFKAGAMHLLVGPPSSSKTTLSLKTAAEVQKINWDTGEVDMTYSNPCPVIWIDMENCFDPQWAKANGVVGIDDDIENAFVVVCPESGEMWIDMINDIIASHAASLVITDSLEMVVTAKEIDSSAEDSTGLGDRAKLLNRAFRKWTVTSRQSRQNEKPWQNTTLLSINQFREKITMMGDPREVPGGRGQLFAASTITFLSKGKLVKHGTSKFGMGEFGGVVEKNKTATPKKNFRFDMSTVPLPDLGLAYVDNVKTIMSFVKSVPEWCYQENKEWHIMGGVYRVQDDFKTKLAEDKAFYAEVAKQVYARFNGTETKGTSDE